MKNSSLTCKLILPVEYANLVYDFDELTERQQAEVLRYIRALKAENAAGEKNEEREV